MVVVIGLRKKLSNFEAPTSLAMAHNLPNYTPNFRKRFLDGNGLLNSLGLKEGEIEVNGEGVEVAGADLEDLNKELEEEGLGDLTLIPSASFRRDIGSEKFEQLSEEANVINPYPIPSVLGDKAEQNWAFWDDPGAVPGYQPMDYYLQFDDVEKAAEEVKDDFIEEVPLVVKKRASNGGKNIYFYPDGVEDMAKDWIDVGIPEDYIAQYAIPHKYDLRVIAAGDTPVSAMKRYGSDDTDRANLSLLNGNSTEENARLALANDAAEPVETENLDPAVERIIEDHVDSIAEKYGLSEEDMNTWVGWDFLALDPYDPALRAYPDEVIEPLMNEDYRTEDGEYLFLCEGNLSPGSIIDFINQEPEQDTAANLLAYGEAVSKGEDFERGIPDLMDEEILRERYQSL